MEDSNSLTTVESFRLRKNVEIFFWMRSKTQVFPGTHVLDEEYTEREGEGEEERERHGSWSYCLLAFLNKLLSL